MKSPLPRLHAITDERVARRADLLAIAADLMEGGGPELAFHARGRELTGLEHYELAVRLSDSPSVRLFVNDRLDVALATRASGVQLGSGSLAVADARHAVLQLVGRKGLLGIRRIDVRRHLVSGCRCVRRSVRAEYVTRRSTGRR